MFGKLKLDFETHKKKKREERVGVLRFDSVYLSMYLRMGTRSNWSYN